MCVWDRGGRWRRERGAQTKDCGGQGTTDGNWFSLTVCGPGN